jgi:hypothetical protein
MLVFQYAFSGQFAVFHSCASVASATGKYIALLKFRQPIQRKTENVWIVQFKKGKDESTRSVFKVDL